MSYNLFCVLQGSNGLPIGDNLGFVATSGPDCGASLIASQIDGLGP